MWKKHEKALGIQRKRRTIFSGRSMSERLQAETTFEEKICNGYFLVKGQSGLYIHRRKVKDEETRHFLVIIIHRGLEVGKRDFLDA